MKEILSFKRDIAVPSAGHDYHVLREDYGSASNKLFWIKVFLSGYAGDYQVGFYQDNKSIIIYSEKLIKYMMDTSHMAKEEEKAFEDEFFKYQDKRWDDMPKVEVTNENWEDLEKKWKLADEKEPEYIVFYLDSSGPIDKVEMVFKDKLSEEDIELMKKNHEHVVKYRNARKLYEQNHPDYSKIWRGPQDDEYEADIMKYYDSDE